MHREFHEQNLCVCDVCGRVSFTPSMTSRHGCSDHIVRGDAISGFHRTEGPGIEVAPVSSKRSASDCR